MKHNITLEGFAYRLRPIKLSDASFIIETRLEDKERNRFIHTISSDISIQEKWLESYFEREGDYYFVIENRLTGEREGLISFYDVENDKAEWGRWVIKKNSLAAVESVYLLYKAAFEKVGLKELYCRTLELNEGVVNFHTSIGEKTRKVIPECFTIDGEKYNAIEQYADRAVFYNEMQAALEKKSAQIFRRNMKMLAGSFEFHHIGVAVNDIEKELAAFTLLGYERESEVFVDENQGIKGCFVTSKNEGPRLELLSNLEGSTTLDTFLNSKVKMYHFGYLVSDIEKALGILQKARARMVSPMKKSVYFGKRICFLIMPNMFMIELIEK
jgi:RimJ/RimL family protein N-acetyltransferase